MTNWKLTKILLALEEAGLPEPALVGDDDTIALEFTKKDAPWGTRYFYLENFDCKTITVKDESDSLILRTEALAEAIEKLKELLNG